MCFFIFVIQQNWINAENFAEKQRAQGKSVTKKKAPGLKQRKSTEKNDLYRLYKSQQMTGKGITR